MSELKYINREENKNLQTKDLITLGLYTILLILLMGVGVGLGTLFTSLVFGGKVYFSTYTSVVTALICGSAYSLVFNKINKNMAIFIMIAIVALFLTISGHSIVGSIAMLLAAIIAEFFYRRKSEYLSYLFFNLGNIGIVLPMFFMKDSYVKHLQGRNYSQEKIDLVMGSSDLKTFILIIVLTVIFSIIGTYLGRKLYFKNFNKAGL
ncbi:MptD family putative ECF transporter S component [Gemella cuniculi]|uniref:MptD family putative ECF transporter S component n=1 Tax=Gemella cuniculi TaxID=150240 RepID=UPI000408AE46|nr:MptD family putative ECF transporter S component [Gemella cuniculi]